MLQTPTRLIDLHIHTTASDGDLSPAACVDEADRLGLSAIAITDHDTMAGNTEAAARGAEVGLEVVPGVEVTTEFKEHPVHLLGYFPEPDAPALKGLIQDVLAWRDERNPRILERLDELGCPMTAGELAETAGGDVIGRPHMASLMVAKGYARSVQHAFNEYLGESGAAYIQVQKPDPAAAIDALLRARAVPVLAHPGTMRLHATEELEAIVLELADMGLRGIEAYYSSHRADLTALYIRVARRLGLVVTGGSDFHGSVKPDVAMGSGFGNLAVPCELLDELKEARERLV